MDAKGEMKTQKKMQLNMYQSFLIHVIDET